MALEGLARDGGLYVPELFPHITKEELAALRGKSYVDVAFEVLKAFFAGVPGIDLRRLLQHAFTKETFEVEEIVEVKRLAEELFLAKLFRCPTLSFKDYSLQLVGRVFNYLLAQTGTRATVIGATSGDTGSSAIEAMRGCENVEVCIFHPRGLVAEIQRLQMTTVLDGNIHNFALEGTFDDCQAMTKALFKDPDIRAIHPLAVNSIGWVRIASQMVFLVSEWLQVTERDDEAITVAIPTGNFGHALAAYYVRKMGVPIKTIIVCSNENDVLPEFYETGVYRRRERVIPTTSPSMDIQVSSNFERFVYEASGGDADLVRSLWEQFETEGSFRIEGELHERCCDGILAGKATQAEVRETIRSTYLEYGEVIDTHTANAMAVVKRFPVNGKVVVGGTASPHKFPEVVKEALGASFCEPMPERLARLFLMPERVTTVPNDFATVKKLVLSCS